MEYQHSQSAFQWHGLPLVNERSTLQEAGVHVHLFFPNFIKHFPDFHLCLVELMFCTDSSIEDSVVGMNLAKETARAQAVDRTPCAQNALLLSFRL